MNTHIIYCPVCHSRIIETYYSGPFGIEEDYISCPKCNYAYEFAYGNYREIVHNKQFIWSYRDYNNHSNISAFFKKIDKAKFMAQRNWKTRKKTTQLCDPTDNCISPKNKSNGCKNCNSYYITYNF